MTKALKQKWQLTVYIRQIIMQPMIKETQINETLTKMCAFAWTAYILNITYFNGHFFNCSIKHVFTTNSQFEFGRRFECFLAWTQLLCQNIHSHSKLNTWNDGRWSYNNNSNNNNTKKLDNMNWRIYCFFSSLHSKFHHYAMRICLFFCFVFRLRSTFVPSKSHITSFSLFLVV